MVSAAEGGGKGDELAEKIVSLQKEQKEMLARKKRLQSDLRNAKRKKSRLTKRARQLSDSDLIHIMQMRDAKKKRLGGTEQHNCEGWQGRGRGRRQSRRPGRRTTAVAAGERPL